MGASGGGMNTLLAMIQGLGGAATGKEKSSPLGQIGAMGGVQDQSQPQKSRLGSLLKLLMMGGA